jgi:hypothetical protein
MPYCPSIVLSFHATRREYNIMMRVIKSVAVHMVHSILVLMQSDVIVIVKR